MAGYDNLFALSQCYNRHVGIFNRLQLEGQEQNSALIRQPNCQTVFFPIAVMSSDKSHSSTHQLFAVGCVSSCAIVLLVLHRVKDGGGGLIGPGLSPILRFTS